MLPAKLLLKISGVVTLLYFPMVILQRAVQHLCDVFIGRQNERAVSFNR